VLKQAWRWFPKSEADRDDMRQEVHAQLWKELCDPMERFWEVRFYHALKCLCFDVATRLTRAGQSEEPWPRHIDEAGEAVELDVEDPDPVDPDEQVFVAQALGRLDEPVRTAVYLSVIEGWPTHSQDPSVVTISRVLGVTDRTVRNYLNVGLATLREWHLEETGYASTD
jgi:DNA-directed RNA polymerase specialized sigma24 family protein